MLSINLSFVPSITRNVGQSSSAFHAPAVSQSHLRLQRKLLRGSDILRCFCPLRVSTTIIAMPLTILTRLLPTLIRKRHPKTNEKSVCILVSWQPAHSPRLRIDPDEFAIANPSCHLNPGFFHLQCDSTIQGTQQ